MGTLYLTFLEASGELTLDTAHYGTISIGMDTNVTMTARFRRRRTTAQASDCGVQMCGCSDLYSPRETS